jgi:aminopeptidase
LKGRFEAGRLVEFSAEDGEATFREYIASDPNANRLGEVALVGIDSPIFQEGVVFEEILFDENAACHIAVGSAYQFCINGGPEMSKEELEKIGCNDSTVHTDMMISDETVSVTAILHNGERVPLLKDGRWVE